MNKKQKRVIILLIKPFLQKNEEKELMELLKCHLDWSAIIGMLIAHRVIGLAFLKLKDLIDKYGFLEYAFSKILPISRDMYNVQAIRMKENLERVIEISAIFKKEGIPYVLLKGVALTLEIYEDFGSRNFNDSDILTHPSNLQAVLKVLKEHGYIQGRLNHSTGEMIELNRRDIITRSLISHEVIPLQKKIENHPFVLTHEIDLQFSVNLMSSKRTDEITESLISRRISIETQQGHFYSLQWEDHFIFLCIHYFKEASTDSEVKLYNDLSLYKLCDITYLLLSSKISLNYDIILDRISIYDAIQAVYFALNNIKEVFGQEIVEPIFSRMKIENTDFLNQVFYYDSNKVAYSWKEPLIDRIFNMDRVGKVINK